MKFNTTLYLHCERDGETDFFPSLHHMVKLGHHGLSRFNMFQMEMVVGQIGFGDNSTYPQTLTAREA